MFLGLKGEISLKEEDAKLRLKDKLATYTLQEKKEIYEQMIKRRQHYSQPLLENLTNKEEKIQQGISKNKRKVFELAVQEYEPQILEGQSLLQFKKIRHFSFEKGRQQQSQANLYCPICYQEFQNKILIAQPYTCFHIFHTTCIEKWFKSKQIRPNCPVCRTTNIEKYEHLQQITELKREIQQLQQKQQFLKEKFEGYLLK